MKLLGQRDGLALAIVRLVSRAILAAAAPLALTSEVRACGVLPPPFLRTGIHPQGIPQRTGSRNWGVDEPGKALLTKEVTQ
jgi:hypothetical protein